MPGKRQVMVPVSRIPRWQVQFILGRYQRLPRGRTRVLFGNRGDPRDPSHLKGRTRVLLGNGGDLQDPSHLRGRTRVLLGN